MPFRPSSNQPHELDGWWGLREVDYLIARLGRYTRFVVYGKWSLLSFALLLTISLIAYPLLTKDKSGMRVSFVDRKLAGKKAASPVMKNPEYRGVTDKGGQYKVTGTRATQKTSTLIEIETVEAQLVKPNQQWYQLNATRAEYQQDKKLLDLFGEVTVIDGNGTMFVTEHATVETQTGHIYGKSLITGNGSMGNLVASGFEINDNANHITFVRGDAPVRVTVASAKRKQ